MRDPWPIWLSNGTALGVGHAPINPITRQIIERLMAHQLSLRDRASAYRVLDVGAGPQTPLADCIRATLGADVTAADLVPADVLNPSVPYIHKSLQRIPFRGKNRQHAVVASTVWEYVRNRKEAFSNLRRVLRPGGLLVSVLHAPDTPWVAEFRRVYRHERKLYDALGGFFDGSVSAESAIRAIREHQPWARHDDESAAQTLLTMSQPRNKSKFLKEMESGMLEAQRQIGEQLAAGLFGDGQFERLLERNGFRVLPTPVHPASMGPFRVVAAVMKRRRGTRRTSARLDSK